MATLSRMRTIGAAIIGCAVLLIVFPGAARSGTAALADARRIVDDAGRTITVDRPFRRIISLYPAHTENLFALGAGDQVVGVSPSETYPREALQKPVFSSHDGAEKFLAAQPDLILARPMIDQAYGPLLAQLEGLGIKVVSVQPHTVAEMFTYWRILGTLTGSSTRADQMIAEFERSVAEFRRRAPAADQRPKVYFESIHGKMKTFAPESMAVFALTTAGGVNIAADAEPVSGTNIAAYGKEKLLERGAEIEVYLAQVGPMNRTSLEIIRNEPGFQVIRAVREGRVFLIDEGLVSRPTMRLLDGIAAIAKQIYPN